MKGGDIRTPPFLFYYNLSLYFPLLAYNLNISRI
jgi:hypothetical protein